ncbi:3069_t:CDS:2, partial [Dentiscutata erythropus]
IKEGDDFSDVCSQLDMILSSTQQSQYSNIEMDVDIGVVDRKLEFSVLINQCCSHEVYTNQRIERKVAGLSTSVSSNKFNSLISYLSSNESARPGVLCQNRWRMRSRLEQLTDGTKNSVRLAEISIANVSLVHPVTQGGFGIGQINDTIFLFQILALYYKNLNYHSFIESYTNIDELLYILVKVFSQLRYNLFSLISDNGYTIFTHISLSSFIYYFGKGNFVSFDKKLELLTVNNSIFELFNYFNTPNIKQRL